MCVTNLASFMKYVLLAPSYRWRKLGLSVRNKPKVAELISGWTGLSLVWQLPLQHTFQVRQEMYRREHVRCTRGVQSVLAGLL